MNPSHGNPSYNPPLVYTRNHSKPTYNTYVLYVNVFHTRIVLRIAYEILPSVTHFSLLSFRIHRDGISPVVGKTVSYYGYFVVNHSEKKKKKMCSLSTKSFIRRLTPLSKASIFQSKRLNLFCFNNRDVSRNLLPNARTNEGRDLSFEIATTTIRYRWRGGGDTTMDSKSLEINHESDPRRGRISCLENVDSRTLLFNFISLSPLFGSGKSSVNHRHIFRKNGTFFSNCGSRVIKGRYKNFFVPIIIIIAWNEFYFIYNLLNYSLN